MQLRVDERVPNLRLESASGSEVKLAALADEAPLMLLFLRHFG